MLKRAPDWERDSSDWPNRVCSRFVRAGGVRWHVQVDGTGPVALLLHGTGGATHSWRGVLPRLAERMTVVAPDLPGHGFSAAPPDGRYSSDALRSRVEALLEHLDRSPSLLVGHSAGAAVAVRLSRRLGSVRGVVGIAPSLAPPPGARGGSGLSGRLARRAASSSAAAAAAALAARSSFLERTLASTGTLLPPEQIELYRRLSGTRRHAGAALSMMSHWDPEGVARDLARLEVPALMLAGGADAWIPPAAVRASVAGAADGVVVEEVEGAGHLDHEVSPGVASGRVVGFAEGIGLLKPDPPRSSSR